MPGPDDKDFYEAVTTPLGSPGGASAPPLIPEESLRALSQRYDLQEELGRGGMGIVYRARDRETGDLVALKILRPEIAAHAELMEQFKAELLLARKITHKNVCRVHDLSRVGDVAAISMEYVEGESLRSLLRRVEGLSLRHGLKIAAQVLAGLKEAHAQGVVHRDLKPENILIASDGTVKVMDFGLARSLQTEAQPGVVSGTPAYMSPEQALGQATDHRSDIYSLGLILFEMFTGQPVFRADTPVTTAMKQLRDAPPAPRDVEPYLPAFLDRAIRKCLEKNPAKRFPSVAELEATLAERQEPESAPEAEPAAPARLLEWRPADWALVAIGIVSLLYFLGFRERVFPASKMSLQVDAISARRAAEELGRQLGRPFPEIAEAQMETRAHRYVEGLEFWMGDFAKGRPRPPVSSVWPTELVVWKVNFHSSNDHLLAAVGDVPERFAIINAQGRALQFFLPASVSGGYQPASMEERRAIARRAVEQVCGPLPSDYLLTESAGGDRSASYLAVWRPRRPEQRTPLRQVSLLAEKVTDLRCSEPARELRPAPMVTFAELRSWIQVIFWTARGVAVVLLILLFFAGRCYRSPSAWRRLPLAVVLGFAGAWMFAPGLGSADNAAPVAPSLPLLVILGFAGSIFIWMGLLTAEHYLRRNVAERMASYLLALRARWKEPVVGMAVVRGALLGLALAAGQTVLLHIGAVLGDTLATDPRTAVVRGFFAEVVPVMLPGFFDPTALGQALQSFSPAAYVVLAALFNGVVISVILLGVPLAWYWKRSVGASHKVPHPRTTLLSESAGLILYTGLSFHLAQFLPRPFGWLFGFGGMIFLLTWLMWKFDVLTVVAAVATTVLWNLNYPLLVILRELGNAPHWAIFIGWGAFVLTAAALAFQANLRRVRQQVASSFE